MKPNIFITGFSGTGKSTVSRDVARSLGWSVVELDDEIERVTGKSIPNIFSDLGEQHFRRIESECLASVAAGRHQVISTGGGVVVNESNRSIMSENGIVVCLEATPDTILLRFEREILQNNANAQVRPMLESANPKGRVLTLKKRRQSAYALSDWTVHTDNLRVFEVAKEIVRAWTVLSTQTSAYDNDSDLASIVNTSTGVYPIWVGRGILHQLGERIRALVSAPVAYIVSDEAVHDHARQAQRSLEASGIASHLFFVPKGETSKTLETAKLVYGWLADLRAERRHVIVAMGGGVVGDLAGLVAATNLRGMPFVQVPTTLLAMMDASIGGKVAIDLPQGKNLVGSFYQPNFVLADVKILQTLPNRELTSGWAEAIKHGLILDKDLLTYFEENRESILSIDNEFTVEFIKKSIAVKAGIVSKDEKETLGLRMLLNYGHTIGHAIEVVTGYKRFLHGEAVSIGMMGAAYISNGMGILSQAEVDCQRKIIESIGLPTCYGQNVDIVAVNQAMRADKKISNRAIRWVLLNEIGSAVLRDDVPDELVQTALRNLMCVKPGNL